MLGWFAKRKTDPKRVLDQVLGKFELPSFPVVVAEAMRQLRDPDQSLSDIATGLQRDPKVTVRILNLANSPAYSLRHPVRNVQHAVSLLGRSEVEALLLSVAVRGALPKTPRWFDDARFWQASARRAASARALAVKLHPSTASEARRARARRAGFRPRHARRGDERTLGLSRGVDRRDRRSPRGER